MLLVVCLKPLAPILDRVWLFLVRAGRVKDVVVVDLVDRDEVGFGCRTDQWLGFGHSSLVNLPSTFTFTPSISTNPPLRRSTTMSQCSPDSLLLPVSGYPAPSAKC